MCVCKSMSVAWKNSTTSGTSTQGRRYIPILLCVVLLHEYLSCKEDNLHLTCITKRFNSAIQDFSPSSCQSTALLSETSITHQPRRRPPLSSPHSTSTRPVHQVNLRIAQACLSSKYHLATSTNDKASNSGVPALIDHSM